MMRDQDDDDRYNYNQDQYRVQQPTCFDKIKLGVEMGAVTGLCIGLIFGTYTIMRHGSGPKGVIGTLASVMIQSAASFGLFLGVGSGLRCEEKITNQQFQRRTNEYFLSKTISKSC